MDKAPKKDNRMKVPNTPLFKRCTQSFLLLFGFLLQPSIANAYQVDIGWAPGFISEYNYAQTYIADSAGKVITHFGGRNSAGGALGTGVQNSPKADFPTPSTMQVTWLSFKDGHFWQANINLPEKQITQWLNERIQGVFVSRPQQKVPRYDKLVVNVGPKGAVYVFLGGVDIKLIGQYQGKQIDIPWATHVKETWSSAPAHPMTQSQYVKNVQSSRQDTLNQAEQFDEKIFRTIKWRLTVNQPNELMAYTAQMMNGEDQTILNHLDQVILNSTPKLLIFDVKKGLEIKRYRVKLAPEIEAFLDKQFNLQNHINFNLDFPNPNEARLYLKQGTQKIEFKKIEVEEMAP